MKPRMIVEQKITPFVNKYKISGVNTDGTPASLIGLAQQKRLAIKEKVTFYNSETKTQEIFSFRAEKAMDIHGRYFVEDPNGVLIGSFQKQFKASLVNSTWKVYNADGGEIALVKESNDTLAAMRRFIGFIPILGDLAEIIISFFKYHFIYIDLSAGTKQAMYTKTALFRDKYRFDATDDMWDKLDWRVWASMAVALDALQSR